MSKTTPAQRQTITAVIVEQSTWAYTLFNTADGLYLDVLAGSVGIYNIVIKLTEDECTHYAAEGKTFLDKLSSDIAYYYPGKYSDRALKIDFRITTSLT